ncbi:MAG: GNAT family N-acetyltransferase [Bacteroidia bacterium]|nr:GNAT family N-acetyltransferase [Bacteroidia bacterium]
MIAGPRISLVPMSLKDRRKFFRWATQSVATPWWYGELYGDEIPDYEVFKMDWPAHYFEDGSPESGRCYAIIWEGEAIGQVNYHQIHLPDRSTELDIILPFEKHTGHGIGQEAMALLSDYLFNYLAVTRINIELLAQNKRAIHSCERSGYRLIYSYCRHGIEWVVLERQAAA